MKARVANMLICRQFDKWVESIEDAKVKELVKDNTILTGGALVTLLTQNTVNDFDFYFRQLLDSLKAKSDASGSVDQTYLMELIDRIV